MKKFVTLLTSVLFVGSITVNVVSCKSKSVQIQLIMDGKGSVEDN